MFPKIVGFPLKSSILIMVFHYKPSILGYPYFWKHPYNEYTPWKINIEPENDGLEIYFPFQLRDS